MSFLLSFFDRPTFWARGRQYCRVLCSASQTRSRADVVLNLGLNPAPSPSLQQQTEQPVRNGDRVWSRDQCKQRVWKKEEFRRLEAISFTVFVGNLPEDISKKELHLLFGWTGKINDIYISRKMKENYSFLFAFIRFATKSGAVKAIETMHNTFLRGNRMFIEEARTRRDNKQVVEYGNRLFSRDEFVKGEQVVHGRVWDPSVELVMFVRGEVGEHEVKIGITKEILDEWKFVEVEYCPVYVTSKERDPLADITMLKYNEVDEDQVSFVHIEEVLNGWNFVKDKADSCNKDILSGQNSNWSDSRRSDRTITWPCGGK
ncbi:hypothetical protein PIB30_058041 [Stylosanthes scabra]|uniref:RRM domain-containing protein n=1 Tax=Stylosanthes scabra TaxID=79078 RepID=A0ABU6WLI7_9FABA|nr:hypothetical protein [Stylosanthes scabra]